METRRLHEKNKIREQIKLLNKYNETDTATISSFKDSPETKFSLAQIQKLTLKINTRNQEVIDLTERMDDIINGVLDEEFSKPYPLGVSSSSHTPNGDHKQKSTKSLSSPTKDKSRPLHKPFSMATRETDKNSKSTKKEMEKSYEYFTRMNGYIPEYILKNLETMPNNRGYIFKDIRCYGKLPAEKGNTTVLFENRPDKLLIIHEWDGNSNEYRIYNKVGKEARVLIKTTKLR